MSEAGYFPLNTTVVQGDDLPFTLYFTDDDDLPIDISTWDFFYTVKEAFADADTEAKVQLQPSDFTVSNGDGTNDKLTFLVPKASTAVMDAGDYYQDLQTIRSTLVTTLGKGVFVVEDQVTVRVVAP